MRRKLTRLVLSLTLAALSLTTLTGEIGFREDELRCEEAKKHLQDCCGAQLVNIDCVYVPGGCDSDPTYPQLDVKTATCVRDTSCDTLRGAGACGGDFVCE